MKTIGIAGAGVMGKGVAQRFAQYGYDIILMDINEQIVLQAKKEIARNLRMLSFYNKNIDATSILDRIKVTAKYEDLSVADYIIENVVENEEIKKEVYTTLQQYIKEDSIIMANTSCIPITKIGAWTTQADKVIGVHLMNPVPVKNFAEVIKGIYTSEDTIAQTKEVLHSAGISCEVVNDSAGFVSNRLSHLFMNEAIYLVYEGVATAEQIDNIFKNAFGHKMGPLETADLIGLDTVLDSLKILYDQYEDSKYRACPLLKRKVEAGMLGRKSGEGFYTY